MAAQGLARFGNQRYSVASAMEYEARGDYYWAVRMYTDALNIMIAQYEGMRPSVRRSERGQTKRECIKELRGMLHDCYTDAAKQLAEQLKAMEKDPEWVGP